MRPGQLARLLQRMLHLVGLGWKLLSRLWHLVSLRLKLLHWFRACIVWNRLLLSRLGHLLS